MGSSDSSFAPHLSTWSRKEHWQERVITFDNSWFTLTMGTGIIVQLFHYFPYASYWLSNLAYCFWILDIVLFGFFTVMALVRLVWYPKVAVSVLDDLSQTSFLGAIPITIDAITVGIVLFYSDKAGAVYVAEAFYWVAVTLTILVGCGGIFAIYRRQGSHDLNEVTGVLLLSFIPMIVTAALGSTLSPYLQGHNEGTVLIVSFLMLSLGIGVSFMIVTIYFWRLLHCSLPERDAIVSCFVPVGPFGMGAFAILGLSLDLARFVSNSEFDFIETGNPPISEPSRAAVAQMIEWIGVLLCLSLLGFGTFFLIEAFASVAAKVPKSFSIGFWSFVFPCGVYANAFCRLSTVLRNDGMKGWAATCVVGTVLLWLFCATLTLYKGIWRGRLFVAPGLQGHIEQQKIDKLERSSSHQDNGEKCVNSEAMSGEEILRRRCNVSSDGTYERSAVDHNEHV